MTEEDQNAAIGRMVTRFSEAKKQRALLLDEAQQIGSELKAVATALNGANSVKAFSDADPRRGDYSHTPDLPTFKEYAVASRVNDLVNQLRTVSAEIRQIRASLKDAGLNVE